jgi:hypothetical protein
MLALVSLLGTAAWAQKSMEYAIKAGFLYNFVKFTDWPAQVLAPNSPTITIGVLGSNPFGKALTNLNGKSAKGKTLVVRQFSSVPEPGTCHVLFVPASEVDRHRQQLESLRSASILTVGERKGFARDAGIINFMIENDRVRFEVNPTAAERAKLGLSSELLKSAKIVRS